MARHRAHLVPHECLNVRRPLRVDEEPTYCSAERQTMTRRPGLWATGSNARGGIVWGMRTAVIPFATICAKSRSMTSTS